jgi:biotin carboxyl carrier protein
VRRIVYVDGRVLSLEWSREGNTVRFRTDGGAEREAGIIEVEPGVYSVLLGTTSYEARISPSVETLFIDVRGEHVPVQVIDPREEALRGRAGVGEGRVSVKAPMPGKVIRTLSAVGDTVEAGQGLLVVEAMKMQNELKSPKAGRVVSLEAQTGATVAAGQVLAVVE